MLTADEKLWTDTELERIMIYYSPARIVTIPPISLDRVNFDSYSSILSGFGVLCVPVVPRLPVHNFSHKSASLDSNLVDKINRIKASANGTDPVDEVEVRHGTEPEVVKMTKLLFISLKLTEVTRTDLLDQGVATMISENHSMYSSNMSNINAFMDSNPVGVILVTHCKTGNWMLVNHCNIKRLQEDSQLNSIRNMMPGKLANVDSPQVLRMAVGILTVTVIRELSDKLNIELFETIDIHNTDQVVLLEPSLIVKRISATQTVFDFRVAAANEEVEKTKSTNKMRRSGTQLINTAANNLIDPFSKALIGMDGWTGYTNWLDPTTEPCPSGSCGLFIETPARKYSWTKCKGGESIESKTTMH
eukprot:GHVH01003756.1.p1 GENE.GHVH01003756.1~~GHVH01003756.1.p1  ORF type:complete len:412 (+),score=36.87 GHVH01003756.1:154-1236(+)